MREPDRWRISRWHITSGWGWGLSTNDTFRYSKALSDGPSAGGLTVSLATT